jgi:hypothetical protein
MMQSSIDNHTRWLVRNTTTKAVKTNDEPRSQEPGIDYSYRVTVFHDVHNAMKPKYMTLADVVSRIRNGNSQDLIERIRAGETGLKRELPCICFSGIFSHRADIGLIRHSGLICLDYDNIADINSFKDRICKNPFTHVAFISSSGTGLKVIVKILGNHTEAVRSLGRYFPAKNLNLQADVSRICFESWDSQVYYNQYSMVFIPQSIILES